MKISATTVESFRLFQTADWMTEEKFLSQVKRTEPKSKYAELGIAFHEIIQNPHKAFNYFGKMQPDGHDFLASNGVVFPYDTIMRIYSDIDYRFPFELKFDKDYIINGQPVKISMRCDQLISLVCVDFKAVFTQYDFTKYMDSMQWKIYCDITEAEAFQYLVYEFGVNLNLKRKHKPALLRPYMGMQIDIINIISEFVEYIHIRQLEGYFND